MRWLFGGPGSREVTSPEEESETVTRGPCLSRESKSSPDRAERYSGVVDIMRRAQLQTAARCAALKDERRQKRVDLQWHALYAHGHARSMRLPRDPGPSSSICKMGPFEDPVDWAPERVTSPVSSPFAPGGEQSSETLLSAFLFSVLSTISSIGLNVGRTLTLRHACQQRARLTRRGRLHGREVIIRPDRSRYRGSGHHYRRQPRHPGDYGFPDRVAVLGESVHSAHTRGLSSTLPVERCRLSAKRSWRPVPSYTRSGR